MNIEKVFISRGCADKQDCFAVSNADTEGQAFIAYASGNDVIVANSVKNEIDYVLRNHNSQINCLCLCPNLSQGYYNSLVSIQNEIISCDCDGLTTVWRQNNNEWLISQSFKVQGLIESVSCFGVSDNESLLLVTTDKRELYVYYRNNFQAEWQCILQTLSPHPDIYYTCTGCLPLHDCPEGAKVSEPTVLLFLCGTDHHIYVNQLSIQTKVMQPLCVLTGFENWIASIRFHRCFTEENQIAHWSVIAAGQDGRCRIWRIGKSSESVSAVSTHNYHLFNIDAQSYLITLESVIEMSSTILSCVEPYPVIYEQSRYTQPFFLLASSLDATVKVYAPEDTIQGTGVFSALITLQPHLIGSQGFWGGSWLITPTERSIYAYGYHGAMFHWLETANENRETIGAMHLKPFLSGHFGPSRVAFTRYGNMLMSSSLDRTVRIWGRELSNKQHWGEVSRPIVHGYPVTGVVSIQDHYPKDGCCGMTNQEIGRIVTINEEKKSRVFNNTLLNMITLNTLVDSLDSQKYSEEVKIGELSNTYYWSSFAPELGLSNKGIPLDQAQSTLARFQLDVDANKGIVTALHREEGQMAEEDENNNDAMMLMANDGELELLVSLDVLQTVNNEGSNNLNESRLCKGTLVTEATYLYNAYTINNFISMAYDPRQDMLFTTTVGGDENESVITVWSNRDCDVNNENLKRIQYLKGHRSTVVSLTPFMLNGIAYLLSAGKDRQLRIWKSNGCEYEACACMMKAHARILWSSCVVMCGNDCAVIATGSRDMTVKLWLFNGSEIKPLKEIQCEDAVKAVAATQCVQELDNEWKCLLAIGLENGDLIFHPLSIHKNFETVEVEKSSVLKLRSSVNTIDWLPLEKEPGVNRTFMDYYGMNYGNVVVGCDDGGVYLYHVSNE